MATLNVTGWGGFLFRKEIVVVGFCRAAWENLQKPQGEKHKLYQQQLSEEFVNCQKLRSCEEDEQGDKDELIEHGDKGIRSILLPL